MGLQCTEAELGFGLHVESETGGPVVLDHMSRARRPARERRAVEEVPPRPYVLCNKHVRVVGLSSRPELT